MQRGAERDQCVPGMVTQSWMNLTGILLISKCFNASFLPWVYHRASYGAWSSTQCLRPLSQVGVPVTASLGGTNE